MWVSTDVSYHHHCHHYATIKSLSSPFVLFSSAAVSLVWELCVQLNTASVSSSSDHITLRIWKKPQISSQEYTLSENFVYNHATAKSLQSCPALREPTDGSPPGSPVPRILQARSLEWVAIFCSNAWKWKVNMKSFSCVRLLATPWTAAHQAPPPTGFSRQEYWSGVPLSSPEKETTFT